MSKYRLIALDLDGTAVLDGQMPSPAVREAVAAAEQRGVQVVLATGRPYQSALTYASALNLRSPVICYQGALVKEAGVAAATLFAEAMPRAPLVDLLSSAVECDLDLNLYSERAIYLPGMRHSQEFYDLWFGLPIVKVNALDDGLRTIDQEGLVPLKCLFIGEPEANDRLIATLRTRFEGSLSVVRSHPLFVEAVSPAASKGRALAYLAERCGLSRDEVVAVGDSGNDLSMVRWAGMGVAMGNATPDVQAVADWVAPTVTEDGVAAVIDRFVLRNGRG